jgi:hypothetical protein
MKELRCERWVIVCGWVGGGDAFVDLKEINACSGSGFVRICGRLEKDGPLASAVSIQVLTCGRFVPRAKGRHRTKMHRIHSRLDEGIAPIYTHNQREASWTGETS